MNSEHPIQGLMNTAMNSIKDMVDVNTIIGDPVEGPEGTVIIPVSKVTFGFAAGGAEYNTEILSHKKDSSDQESLPFGGGSGAGISINPVGFLVVGQGQIRLLPVGNNTAVDRLIDMAPELVNKVNDMMKDKVVKKKSEVTTKEIITD